MKFNDFEFSDGKNSQHGTSKKLLLLLALSLVFLTIVPLYLLTTSHSPLPSPKIDISDLRNIGIVKECDIFSGKWIPYPNGPYYTNATCSLIIDQQNCMKFGRPDREFMEWSVTIPEDISHRYTADTTYFKRWFYADYGFTLATLWSPFLVKSTDADPNGHSLNSLMSLYLDQADEAWASQIENFDYVIISAGTMVLPSTYIPYQWSDCWLS
ncbi:hypothetical protein OIU78_026333 [Salix suchowensis]|nr:hypothetical protein OIU78_026333 [Salix suchowensis]